MINELKEINKPFIILLNSIYPDAPETRELAEQLSARYEVPVVPVSCLDLDEERDQTHPCADSL